jgi:ATP-dependent DNA helicase RecG
LTDRQKEILQIIVEKPTISREELAKKTGINPSAIQKQLVNLKEKGILKRIGPDKGGHWKIINV